MHEASIMQSALEIAFEHAKKQNATAIHRLGLKIGALSGVVPEALEFAFSALIADTMAEGGVLEVEYVPIVCWCFNCEAEFSAEAYSYECPTCKQLNTEVRKGNEMHLTFVEVS